MKNRSGYNRKMEKKLDITDGHSHYNPGMIDDFQFY